MTALTQGHAQDSAARSASTRLMAINILLLPDTSMQAQAKAFNRLLRAHDPQGFTLDSSHVPHVSLVHLFIRDQDLKQVCEAVSQAGARVRLPLALSTTGFESAPWAGATMVSISVARTRELASLQDQLVKVTAPFSHVAGDANAFWRTPDSPEINSQTIEYVKGFVPAKTGENFKPHITVGLARAGSARDVVSSGLPETHFNAIGIALYQLGNDGTARKRLCQAR